MRTLLAAALLWPAAAFGADCNGVGHLERHDCLRTLLARANSDLNARWGKVRSRVEGTFGKEQYAQVLAAQRLWIRFRDADCKAMSEMTMVGRYWEINRLTCLIRRTRQRTKYLQETYLD